MDIHFDCTQCGSCCHNLKIPLTVSEAFDWLDRGHRVQLVCEAAPWPAEFPADDLRAAHLRRRSFSAVSGSLPMRVVAILVADVTGKCPNLLADMRCGIYERRPLVCQIYPAEINPFIVLKPENKCCPPEAWEGRLPLLLRDGRVMNDEIRLAIQRSRDTDALEVEIKRRLCRALNVADAAMVKEGFLLYSPQSAVLRQALSAALHDSWAETCETQWRFVSDRDETLENLGQLGAVARHSRDSAPQYQYLSLNPLTAALPEK